MSGNSCSLSCAARRTMWPPLPGGYPGNAQRLQRASDRSVTAANTLRLYALLIRASTITWPPPQKTTASSCVS
eukprot:scaffold77063_cov63-Phaeocystis_antarctica.AAC.3